MDKETEFIKFASGETDIFSGPPVMIRERLPNGASFICIKRELGQEHDDIRLIEPSKRKRSDNPQNTGGKKPYLMLMIDEVFNLKKDGVKNVEEMIGYLVSLGKNIEWNTGKLIHKRSKKPLLYKDILKLYGCGNRKLNRLLNEMQEHDLLFHTEEGYFISPKFIKKGRMNKGKGQ
jgi:hypothetical protein